MKSGIDWQNKMQVVTPESVSFSYEIAGIGSRFLALLLDHLIEGFTLLALVLFFSALGMGGSEWGPVLLAAGGFLFLIGYFILFEILWDGQTPGKRILHLRVVRDGGYGLTALESILRNLLRTIDLLPGIYGIGLITMFFSEKSKRLGDFVAGTVVIKDQHTRMPARTRYARGSVLEGLDPAIQITIRGRLDSFSGEELRVIRDFIQRRYGLNAQVRAGLADKINALILKRYPELTELQRGLPPEHLIEAVAAAYEEGLV